MAYMPWAFFFQITLLINFSELAECLLGKV